MTLAGQRHRGFSLSELLVLIVITVVLLGLLLPAIRHVREEANITRCLQQLRSLGAQVLMTAHEHGGSLLWYERRSSTRGLWWYRTFAPSNYEDFTQNMLCASQKASYRMFFTSKGRTFKASYRYNKFLGYRDINDHWVYPLRRLQTLPSPHRIPMLADFAYHGTNQTSDDAMGFESWPPLFQAHRQETVATFVCVDGHAERLTKDREHSFSINPANLIK